MSTRQGQKSWPHLKDQPSLHFLEFRAVPLPLSQTGVISDLYTSDSMLPNLFDHALHSATNLIPIFYSLPKSFASFKSLLKYFLHKGVPKL